MLRLAFNASVNGLEEPSAGTSPAIPPVRIETATKKHITGIVSFLIVTSSGT